MEGSCPTLRFELKGYDVRTTSSTQYMRGNCKDLRDGKDVRLTGVVESPGKVLATRIEIRK